MKNNEIRLPVFNIQHLCVHDGPGIRTTIFLQGCPLHCAWCHNPEGIPASPVPLFDDSSCILCEDCLALCNMGAFRKEEKKIRLDRDVCPCRLPCPVDCPAEAFRMSSRYLTAKEILRQMEPDEPFFGKEGGVTFSGGEPLLHAGSLSGLMKECRSRSFSVTVDTCGSVPFSAFETVLPYTDVFLYDIKAADPVLHKTWTGTDNHLILENLQRLDSHACAIWIRVPVVGSVNADPAEIEKIGRIAQKIRHLQKITLIPYHAIGSHKYALLGKTPRMGKEAKVSPEQLEKLTRVLLNMGLPVK